MAKYLILIYGDEKRWDEESEQEVREKGAAHAAFAAAAGPGLLGGHELQASTTATTLRADPDGRVTPTDGPFLETKEALGGYYLIEAADLDEVISLTKRLPEIYVDHSAVEIRPVVG